MRLSVAVVVLGSSVALAVGPSIQGGEAPPQDLRLSICSLTRDTVQRGRVVEVTPEGRGTQIVWAGFVGAAEPHLVFAWFPRGHSEKARCVDAGLVDPWTVELSSLPSIPVVRSVQTLKGECFSLTRTVVLAWTNGARDFELVSSRTAAGESSPTHEREDSRYLRASELLSDGELHDAERLALGLVGERPWDPDARALLSETWRKLTSRTQK